MYVCVALAYLFSASAYFLELYSRACAWQQEYQEHCLCSNHTSRGLQISMQSGYEMCFEGERRICCAGGKGPLVLASEGCLVTLERAVGTGLPCIEDGSVQSHRTWDCWGRRWVHCRGAGHQLSKSSEKTGREALQPEVESFSLGEKET